MLHRTLFVVICMSFLLAGCSGDDPNAAENKFREMQSAGATCDELHEFHRSFDIGSNSWSALFDRIHWSGCDTLSDGTRPEMPLKNECADAAFEAERIYNTASDRELLASRRKMLMDCESIEQWLAAVGVYPGALGLVKGAEITKADLHDCYEFPDTTVCQDS